MTIGAIKDREFSKFVESPTRGDPNAAIETYVGNRSDQAIPVYLSGLRLPAFGESTTSPGIDVVVISQIILSSIELNDVLTSCHIEGVSSLWVDGVKIATARTAPGKPDAKISLSPGVPIVSGSLIEVKFKARDNSAISEVESYINARVV